MNDLIYSHPKYGWGQIVARLDDDGAALVFHPIDQDGDAPSWHTPMHLVEKDELKEVTQEEWDQRFPDFERRFSTEEELIRERNEALLEFINN